MGCWDYIWTLAGKVLGSNLCFVPKAMNIVSCRMFSILASSLNAWNYFILHSDSGSHKQCFWTFRNLLNSVNKIGQLNSGMKGDCEEHNNIMWKSVWGSDCFGFFHIKWEKFNTSKTVYCQCWNIEHYVENSVLYSSSAFQSLGEMLFLRCLWVRDQFCQVLSF